MIFSNYVAIYPHNKTLDSRVSEATLIIGCVSRGYTKIILVALKHLVHKAGFARIAMMQLMRQMDSNCTSDGLKVV